MDDRHDTSPTHCICGGVGYFTVRCTPRDKGASQEKCVLHGTVHACICTLQDYAGRRREAIREDCGLNLMQQARLTIQSFDARRSPFAKEIKTALIAIVRGEEPRPWLVILGNPGTGKTHACCALIDGLVAQGVPARYTTADDLIEDVRDGAYTEGDSTDKRLRPYFDKPVLALDDVRLDMVTTDAQMNWIERTLLKRYERGAVTVITSNNDVHEFPKRIKSRFEDPLFTRLIVTDGPDERGRVINPDTGEITEEVRP